MYVQFLMDKRQYTLGAPKTWAIVPTEIKVSSSLQQFKSKIKKWKPVGFMCRICKTYVNNLGFYSTYSLAYLFNKIFYCFLIYIYTFLILVLISFLFIFHLIYFVILIFIGWR